ncbi:hypothetical protein QAD02_013158 [Eretmocerus hayati]|uniref:Uncharacterized protein n=1 Tax=Eretmocerus hayati TaxID=131215 RepID=A0ACC2P2T4_9HYME|nr:hypothetical protein QAD02_013158 [Eretmocerus hayati]
MLPLRPRPTKTSQQRAENARKQSISDSSSATSRAPPKRGRKKGSKIEPPERPTNMSGGQGDLDGSTIAKRLRIRKGGPRTQIPILKSSRETTRDLSESLTSSDESEDQEFEEPPIPQRDKSFLPDLLDKGEEFNSANQSSELSDTEERIKTRERTTDRKMPSVTKSNAQPFSHPSRPPELSVRKNNAEPFALLPNHS